MRRCWAAPLAALFGLAPIGLRAEAIGQWAPLIADASQRFGVPQAWIERVMQAESRGHVQIGGHPIRSPAGARGLMQIMPATWGQVRQQLGLGNDPDDPRDNILAGTFYLRAMYDRFGYPGLFAAYNAGPARYAAHLLTGAPLPAETRSYLVTVAGLPDPKASVPHPLFAIDNVRDDSPRDDGAGRPSVPLLFAIDRAAQGSAR